MFYAVLKKKRKQVNFIFRCPFNKKKFIEIGLDLNFKIILEQENVGKKSLLPLQKIRDATPMNLGTPNWIAI